MKTLYFSCIALIILFSSCGPAAEDRQLMHSRAKVFQDSIANFIRTSMAEAETPAPGTAPAQPTAEPQPAPAQQNPPQNITPNTQPANQAK